MTYKGTVKNGVVILASDAVIPEGTEVDVTPREPTPKEDSFSRLIQNLAKPRSHLPPDYALNHGHYVRGEPKK